MIDRKNRPFGAEVCQCRREWSQCQGDVVVCKIIGQDMWDALSWTKNSILQYIVNGSVQGNSSLISDNRSVVTATVQNLRLSRRELCRFRVLEQLRAVQQVS